MLYNLRELGINSEYRAAELEHELGLTFSDFTPEQLDTWQRQTVCLNQYALTRTYSLAARTAGVTVYTMETWERDNELEFVRRKEMADREFCDGLEELLLERARMPDSPAVPPYRSSPRPDAGEIQGLTLRKRPRRPRLLAVRTRHLPQPDRRYRPAATTARRPR